jgi:DNA polymerase-4
VTLPEPTDDVRTIRRLARTLLTEVDTSGGVRLLGIGVSGLADWIQEDLFADGDAVGDLEPLDDDAELAAQQRAAAQAEEVLAVRRRGWRPGMDVVHDDHGPGWVWGAGRGVVTVRFETAATEPGKVSSFAVDDPALHPLKRPDEPDAG